MKTFSRVMFLISALLVLLLLTGCTASWTGEAINIIALLGPAITAALGIVSAFGKGVSTDTLAKIQAWEQQSTTDLATVQSLIQQWEKADAAAQPGILEQISTALSVGMSNLSTLLPELHIADPETQAKVEAIFASVQSEWQALVALIPAIQQATTATSNPHAQLRMLAAHPAFQSLKPAADFKAEFNGLTAPFGPQFQIGVDHEES